MNLDTIELPDKGGQEKEFAFIKGCTYQGVNGVWHINSDIPGPTIGITICTHGNEISGLAALWYFRHHFLPHYALKSGSIIFVLNNVAATERYFQAQTLEEEKVCRKVKDNMNRLPADTMERPGDDSYEIRRAQELRSIWQSFDAALDLHSYTQEGPPMIVSCFAEWPKLIRSWPIEMVLKDIEVIQHNKPACFFYGHEGKEKNPFIGLECGGPHKERLPLVTAITSTMSFLRYLSVIEDSKTEVVPYVHKTYKIIGSVLFPDRTYRVVRPFPDLTEIKQGEVVGRNLEGKEVCSPCDGITLFWDQRETPLDIKEEVFFIAEPLNNR